MFSFVVCLLFVYFFLCSCAVSVIGLMGVTPAHSKELDIDDGDDDDDDDDDGYYYTVMKIVHYKM